MITNYENIIKSACELGAAQTIEALGLSAGELSYTKALKTYGKWFKDAVAEGRIRPCRVESGRAGTQWYRVVTILRLKVSDETRRAELI